MVFARFRSTSLAVQLTPLLVGYCLAVNLLFAESSTITLASGTGPIQGQPGVTSITLAGSNYPAGTINPTQVQITVTPAISGAAPTTTFAPSAITTLYGTSRRLNFTIPSTIRLPSPMAYLVSVSGQTTSGNLFSSGNYAALSIIPAPQISISPNNASPGQSLTATITGQYTNFTQGSTVANFGPGISVGGAASGTPGPVTVLNQTTGTAQLTIDPSAATGTRTPSIQTGVQVATLADGFTVLGQTPTILSVDPNSGYPGQQSLGIVSSIFLTGHDPDFHAYAGGNNAIGASNTNRKAIEFITDPAFNAFAAKGIRKFLYVTANLSPPGGHVDGTNGLIASGYVLGTDFDRADSSALTAALDQLGSAYNAVVIASDFGGILTQSELDILNAHSATIINFLNRGGGLYAMAETSPAEGGLASTNLFGFLPFVVSTIPVNEFEAGNTLTDFGASLGLTSSDINGNYSHNIFSTTGGLNVVDIDAIGEILSLAGRGRVTSGGVGSVIITGRFTHFVPGATQVSFGTGITVGTVTVADSTHLTAQITISPTAVLGGHTVIVTTGAEIASLENGFTVLAPPILTRVDPNTGQQGQQNLSLSITGQNTHFAQGTTTATLGAGVTVTSLTVNSPTSATAMVNIDASATVGGRTVTVITGSENLTLAAGFAVTPGATETPTITQIAPNTGQQGQQNESVSLTGNNTHFVQGTTTASFGAGITVVSLTVSSATRALASINIDLTAAPGTRTVSATTGTETVSLANGFNVTSCTSSGTPPTVDAGPDQSPPIIPDNLLIGLWQSNKVLEYTTAGQYVRDFVPTGSPLAGTGSLRFGPDGNLYVTDETSARKFDGLTGAYLGAFATGLSIGGTDQGDIIFDTAGNAFIGESASNRVSEYSSVGILSRRFTNGVSTPEGLAFRPNGNLLVTNTYDGPYRDTITEIDTSTGAFTTFATGLGEPVGITVGPDGRYYVANYTFALDYGGSNPDTVQVLPAMGGASQTFAKGTDGADNLLFTDNKLFVTSFYDSRVYSFAPDTGQLLGSFHIPVPTREVSGLAVRPSAPSIAFLNGSAKDNAQSSCGVLTSNWSKVSGPGTVSFANPNLPGTTATFSATGVYVLRLSASAGGFAASSDVTINVPANHQPVVYAGPSQTSVLGTIVTLAGTVADDGFPLGGAITVAWSEISGPGNVAFSNPTSPATNANFSAAGVYVLRLAASDGQLTSNSDVMITVASGNVPTLLSIRPSSGTQGQHNLTVSIASANTHFAQGTTTASFGAGITTTAVTVNGATALTAQISIDATASLGLRTVTVTTGSEVASVADVFDVQSGATPILYSLNPGGGVQGQTGLSVAVTGQNTHWVQGTTTASFGAGVTVTSLAITGSTSGTAIVNIDNNAAVGARTVTLTTGSETASFVNGFTISTPGPFVSSVDPGGTSQGAVNFSVSITGQNTHWVQSSTIASFGAGITVASLVVTSPTTATAVINVDPAATIGPRAVTMTTGSEIASFANGFSIVAGVIGITEINPGGGPQGAQNLSLAVTAQYTHWAQTTTAATFGAGVNLVSLTVTSPNTATAVVNVDSTAALGARDATFTTGSEIVTAPGGFTVNAGTPVLTQINPNSGQQGTQNLSVTITGASTHFSQSLTQVFFGANIAIASVTVNSPTILTAVINIAANAATGPRKVAVSTGQNETISLATGFTVTALPATLTSVFPNIGTQGQQNLSVTVAGQNTHFAQNTTTVSFGPGVSVASLAVASATALTAAINIDSAAAVGPRILTVTTGSETASLADAFTVQASTPSPISVSPASGQQGRTLNVTITGQGTNWVQGTTRARFGPGVIVGSGTAGAFGDITVTNPTTATAQLTILKSALPAPRTVTMQTATQTDSGPNSFTVAGAPYLLSAMPDHANQGQTVDVAVNGAYTHFAQGATQVSFGPGISVNGSAPGAAGPVTVNGPTAFTAHLVLDGNTQLGLRTITAQTGSETASTSVNFSVLGPVTGAGPQVTLNSPTEGQDVTAPATVTGSVVSPNLDYWKLEYQAVSSSSFVQFAAGTGTAVSATFDPTNLLNGNTQIRLTAVDTSGQTAAVTVTVVVSRNLKIGNFTVSFNDLSVPVAGIPIQVIRTYDSRYKASSDFGYGWRLDVNTIQLAENTRLGSGWVETSSGGLIPTYCVSAASVHKLTATLNDGTTFEFQPTLSGNCQQLIPPSQVAVGFAPTGITPPNASLQMIGSNRANIDGGPTGNVNLLGEDFSLLDPDGYVLTLPDGRQLQLSMQAGLQAMTDRNGNTLTITSAGIVSSTGKSVTFTRDSQNRITQVIDPNNKTLNYAYDAAGDLASFTDASSNQSTYTYDGVHDLLTIEDPRHVQPIRNDYDVNGILVSHTDAFGNVINYTHDPANNQEIVTDRLGNATVNEYDSAGNIVKVTDALGGVTQRTYDASGNVKTEINALGYETDYEYDANNNRTKVTDPLKHVTSNVYNSHNQLTQTTDARNHATINTYDDTTGNLKSTQDALGKITSYKYTATGQVQTMTDPLLQVTSYAYDSSGNLTKQTDALNRDTAYEYDNNGNKKKETRTRTVNGTQETLVTQYEYDSSNRLTKTTYPDNSTTQIQYNEIGKQSATIDQLNRQTSYDYDLMGRLTQTTYPDKTTETSTYDAEGDRTSSTDRLERTTGYFYDQLKRLKQTNYPDQSSTQTGYDAIGEVKTVTDALGHQTQYQYDQAGRRITVTDARQNNTSFDYDENGNQISMTDANNNKTQYDYDELNRRTKVTYPDQTTDITAYDALGRTTDKTDQASLLTHYDYDALGHLTQVKDALSQLTKYSYDEVGNRILQTDANNHATTFSYDKLGRRTGRTLPLGQSESMTYDAAGNLQNKTDFNGKLTTYGYDSNNNWLTSKLPDPSFNAASITFTYTKDGQRQSMTDPSGSTSYEYDARNRLQKKIAPAGTLSYTYDLAGNLKSINSSNSGGTSVNYDYDEDNRLSKVTDNRLTNGVTTYQYDNAGNLKSYTYPNGVTTAYVYDQLNRLKTLTIANVASTPLASYAYTLGQAGNRTQVTELGGRTVNYLYDNLYRLKSETITNDPGGINGAIGYQYDAVGNRLQRTSTVAPVPAASYTYDFDDRLSSDTYDANGSTTVSNGKTYTYDFENHLISQSSPAVTITYDGDGNRVSETANGVRTQYLVDDRNLTGYAQVLEELSSGAVQRVYTYGLSRISQSQASGTSFYGYDGHGNVRILSNSASAVTDQYSYDAFGNAVGQSGSTQNSYEYSGEQLDSSLGLYNLRARYFEPTNGRFMSVDPLAAAGSDPRALHRYLYAEGNPANNIDPSGLLTVAEVSLSITINNILLSYETNVLFPTFFQAVQCAECVIAPATQMYNMGMAALSDGAGPWAQDLVWHGQAQLVQGYQAIGGIIANNYQNYFKSLLTDAVQIKTDFSLPYLNVIYQEILSSFPAAASVHNGVTRGRTALGKISEYTDGVAEAFGYWLANPHSNCGKAMLFGALGAEILNHMPQFDSPTVTDTYSYALDGLTDDQYRQLVRSALQQIKQ